MLATSVAHVQVSSTSPTILLLPNCDAKRENAISLNTVVLNPLHTLLAVCMQLLPGLIYHTTRNITYPPAPIQRPQTQLPPKFYSIIPSIQPLPNTTYVPYPTNGDKPTFMLCPPPTATPHHYFHSIRQTPPLKQARKRTYQPRPKEIGR